MRNKVLLLSLFLSVSLAACKNSKWVDLPTGTPPEGAITGKPGEPESDKPERLTFINTSYIRGDRFDYGDIDPDNMAACNDLVYLTTSCYSNGDLGFELPLNDATFTGGVTQMATFNGRSGVMKFDGTGLMNGKDGLLHAARPDHEGAFKLFTFGTYIYVNSWVDGASLFKKVNGNSTIVAFQMNGTSVGDLKFTIGNSTATVSAPKLTLNAWHYVTLTYSGSKATLTVDNDPAIEFTGNLPASIANTRADFLIGDKLNGYLDEMFVNSVVAGKLTMNPIDKFDTWAECKTLAYWKFDDASNPGKDSYSWAERLDRIKAVLATLPGERKLRLGVGGGRWLDMIPDEASRINFANNVKKVIDQYDLDGVDLDFEWADNASKYANYSLTILKLREVLGSDVYFTVSLHPVSYRISKEAIDAVDFISYQCYGPSKTYYPYEPYVNAGKAALDYGIPKRKLVMGVPFQGTTGTPGGQVGYNGLVTEGLTDMTIDEYTYKGQNYLFNGQRTIRMKTEYVCTNGLGGIMTWDISLDVPMNNSKSLSKIIKETFDNYANIPQ